MWTKQQTQAEPPAVSPATKPASSATPFGAPSGARSSSSPARNLARLGSSLQIKGHITGTEDLQIDGKVRDRVTAPAGTGQPAAEKLAMESPKVKAALDGRRIERTIYVPDRLVNIVTEQSS